MRRKVRVRFSPQGQIVANSDSCPVKLIPIIGRLQKTACVLGQIVEGKIQVHSRCEFYKAGSIKKEDGINTIECGRD